MNNNPEPCRTCCGDGYLIDLNGPGNFDNDQECWMPNEDLFPCPTCQGTGINEDDQPPPHNPDDDPDTWDPHHHHWTPDIAPDDHLDDPYEPELPF